ncbi:polyprenyl synthetase family protein [Saxibacter everestensis]|uniref:Polyprenyl synthetase family protein n=2 Tax=Saxibacter everestensis TaxID=2909229 RepID=A0ABY8R102_9MICO|nr:polyprenyl synthetase family protein [Brevibacteriaceae bacterium ZFBP1038]
MQHSLEEIEGRLYDAVAQTDRFADRASKHLIEAGGKRVRPMLVLLAAHLGDPTRPEVIDAAVVVELTHLATLYHDDVMDSAPMRRGAPAAHELWGNNVAILTGDLLFARASNVVAGLGPDAVRLQALTFERLCLGQLNESLGPREGEDPVAHYIQVLADKTGSLIATAGRFGARYSGASEEYLDVVAEYGEKVGVAFQLADDVIDLTSDGSVSGKTPGTDLREHVPTLPALYARQDAARNGDQESLELVGLLDSDLTDDADLTRAREALVAHPATARASAEAHRWADEAITALAPLPAGVAKDSLVTFAETVVARKV